VPSTYHGGDGIHLRYQALTASGVQVRVEEDTTDDAETDHTDEVVHYLAVAGSGTLTAEAYAPGGYVETKYYSLGGQQVATLHPQRSGVVCALTMARRTWYTTCIQTTWGAHL